MPAPRYDQILGQSLVPHGDGSAKIRAHCHPLPIKFPVWSSTSLHFSVWKKERGGERERRMYIRMYVRIESLSSERPKIGEPTSCTAKGGRVKGTSFFSLPVPHLPFSYLPSFFPLFYSFLQKNRTERKEKNIRLCSFFLPPSRATPVFSFFPG